MMPDRQAELLRTLAEAWVLVPDMRFGQLVAFLGFLGEDQFAKGLGDIEDDELMAVLYRHKADLLARVSDTSSSVLPPPDVRSAAPGNLQQRV